MQPRRLVKAGQTSHTISLPKEWLQQNKLKKGDSVYLKQSAPHELLITARPSEEAIQKKELTIQTDNKDITTIKREITSAYINNYNTINIIGKDLNKYAKEMRNLIHDFVALEIAEQTSTKIIATDLLNLKEISIEKTLRRMDNIIRTMLQDTTNPEVDQSMYDSIAVRDVDVNRLYFLLFRLLKGTLTDQKLAQALEIKNSQVLSYWYLSLNLENIADNIKNNASILKKMNKTQKNHVLPIYQQIEQTYLDVMKAFHNNERDKAHQVAIKRKDIMNELYALNKKESKADLSRFVGNFKELQTFITNISRIVIDREHE